MSAPGRLIGVGVGPGDPDLVTVKGVKALRAADAVFVPVGEQGGTGYAERVVLAHVRPELIRRITFVLGDDPQGRDRAWDMAGAAVAEVVDGGGTAAFATIGDPNLYSTFTYLAETVSGLVPGVSVETVPGITAMQDLAARTGTVLAEGDQTLALLPFNAGSERLRAALAEHDTVVVYKGGRLLPQVRAELEAAGRAGEAVFGARLGLDGEVTGELPAGAAPYLSAVLVTRPKLERGERL
jgi:precorrin-2/cobalt-factor-2 C20-methyltransferase